MNDRARRVDALFQEALDAPDREAFLASCGALREDVSALLKAHERMGGFLATPAWERLHGVGLGEGDRVGRYTIRRKIAEGGGGAVYEAEQELPRRTIALKLLRRGSPRWLEEAEILARLKHPHIATVHEAGLHGGTAYIAMEFVEGPTLIEAAETLSQRAALELFARVCDVVHYGHLRGVIHRDLKPANVLVRDTGPKVIDFGIAAVTGEGRSEIAGTLPYMSPEQCDGAEIDARSDVYSLGAILCRLTTGRLPCEVEGLSLGEALRTLRSARPPDPGGDLGAIVKRALARDRDERYASAAALADDVRRYLGHEPVLARPPSLLRGAVLLFRRRTGVAVSLLALLVVLVAGVAVSVSFAVRAEHRRAEAVAANQDAELRLYVANLALAQAALRDHDVTTARRRLESAPAPLRDWEWRHLVRQIDLSERTIEWPEHVVWGGAASPDGRLIAMLSADGAGLVKVWDTASCEVARQWEVDVLADCVAFAPDSRVLASGHRDGSVELHDISTGALLRRLEGHTSVVNELAFDRTGDLLASASRDGTVRVWETATGRPRGVLLGHTDRVICVRFGPDGRIFTGCRDGEIRIWTGEHMDAVLHGHEGSVEGVAVSPDGARLASVSRDRTLRIWDLATLRQVAVEKAHTDNVRAVAFGPAGELIATASYDRTVRLWRARDASPVATLRGHTAMVRGVWFPGEVISFGTDGARFWSAGTEPEPLSLRGAFEGVRSIAFDGDLLVGGTWDGTLCWWDVEKEKEVRRIDVGTRVDWLAVAGDRVVTGREGADVRLWPGGEARPGGGIVGAFDPARQRLYAANGGTLAATDVGGTKLSLRAHLGAIRALALDVSRTRVATAGEDRYVRVWEAEGLRGPLAEAEVPECATALCFSTDGSLLAVGHRDGSVSFLDAATLRMRTRAAGHSSEVASLAFHPSGRRLASGAADECVRLWDVTTGAEVAALRAGMRVNSVAFDASGTRLVAGVGNEGVPGGIRIWTAP